MLKTLLKANVSFIALTIFAIGFPVAAGAFEGRSSAGAVAAQADRPVCSVRDGWDYAVGTTSPTATSRVRVWYERSEDQGKAVELARALETDIWPALARPRDGDVGFVLSPKGLAMEPPLDDGWEICNGGSRALDVYLMNLGFFSDYPDYGGVTKPTATGDCHHSPVQIWIDRDLTGDKLKAVGAHEFMHAIQWAYNSKACKSNYLWLAEATANWAIDYVYSSNDFEHNYAPYYMESPEKSLDDITRTNGEKTRDLGAYLLFQFLTIGGDADVVRTIWQATVGFPSSLDAVNDSIPGGFKKLWPEFAKQLWNRAPIDTKPDSFKVWDRLSEQPAVKLDISGDLGDSSETKAELLTEINNLSNTYYRFTFSDENTRSLLFYNGFFKDHQAGKAINVLALWNDDTGAWQEEDWSGYEFVGLCRDLKNQRAKELVIIVSDAEYLPSGGKLTINKAPYLKRNNMGCWKYEGTATMLDTNATWQGVGRRNTSDLAFELDPRATGLQVKDPRFPDSLRVGLAAVLPASGNGYSFEIGYSTGCTFNFGPASFPIGRMPPLGFMFINRFPELTTIDAGLQTWLNQPSHAYMGTVGDSRFITVNVTGPGCSPTSFDIVGAVLMTNEVKNGVIIDAPVATTAGELTGQFKMANWTFNWKFLPKREP